ncbi:MAG: dipeptidyl aminopeptidase/acylaminoacyl peptidase [Planctomycetota bacterium]|jgi:dipeptidyl aminopeptidase/acylaminoacyl peptidase
MISASVSVAVALFALWPSPPVAQDELGRRALEHDDYDKWNSLGGSSLSNDGQWVAFSVRPAKGATTLTIREVGSQKQYTIVGGSSARFTSDSRFAAYVIQPDPEVLEKLREQDKGRDELPQSKLEILDLTDGSHVTMNDVRSFSFPEEAPGWITYSPSKPSKKTTVRSGKSEIKETYTIEPNGLSRRSLTEAKSTEEASSKGKAGESEKGGRDPKPKKDAREKANGTTLVLRDLSTGIERRFPDVTSHRFSKAGAHLAFAASATDAEDDGVYIVDLATGALTQILSGRGSYSSLSFSEDERQLAFMSDRDDYGPVKPSQSLYLWGVGQKEAAKIVDASNESMPEGWWLASSSTPRFTEDGRRLLFDTQPRPDDAGKTKEVLDKEKKAKAKDPQATLDIWHWKDEALQPQQVIQARRERNRSYVAAYDLTAKKAVQLATKEMSRVSVDTRSSADVAVGVDSTAYAVSNSWESPGFSDSFLVDLGTGEATQILEKIRGSASLSPGGSYVTWWDPDLEKYFAMSTIDQTIVDLSASVSAPLANELHDTPSPPRSYGIAGWLEDDSAVLLNDRYDIWQLDPAGNEPARCLTGAKGREGRIVYRYTRLDRELRTIPSGEPMLLSVFDQNTKASGYCRLDAATGEITPIVMLDERLGSLQKAKEADTVVMTRQTFRRYPDLWASTTDFNEMSRLSDANPQQRDYLWGTAELVHYETTDGQPLDGLLYKPDNFDPSKKYPMMVYFYERSSDGLHRYVTPSAGSSSINYSYYVSRGYVLFVPDIPYTTGHPGPSAAAAVLPGVQSILDRGFVDPGRVGVQGHSWGGYQIAYLVTMTNMFACAESGAPVTNMTSAYGGIRWASGMSRMFQYEKTQSRIGDTLWNARDLYLENSPVFFADKVETPLLMLHNDEDGAVPWYQGIEMFVAMRRLSKPVWMLNYNGEGHGLRKKENRLDFAKRMQQFFDHYLMDSPATRWIADGVPAVDKGRDLGLGPVKVEVPMEEPAEAPPEEPSEEPTEVPAEPADPKAVPAASPVSTPSPAKKAG